MTGPSHDHAGKGERLQQLNELMLRHKRLNTNQAAKLAKCSVHKASRALSRLAERKVIRKVGKVFLWGLYVNLWELNENAIDCNQEVV